MTHNQIDFAKLVEDKRHNRVGEIETKRHNMVTEGTGASQVGAMWYNAYEGTRHNTATEGLQNMYWGQLGSAATQNAATNAAAVEETARHNVETEAEAQRHNKKSELIETFKAGSQLASSIASTIRGIAGVVGGGAASNPVVGFGG